MTLNQDGLENNEGSDIMLWKNSYLRWRRRSFENCLISNTNQGNITISSPILLPGEFNLHDRAEIVGTFILISIYCCFLKFLLFTFFFSRQNSTRKQIVLCFYEILKIVVYKKILFLFTVVNIFCF